MNKDKISASLLRECLNYDRETGDFTWLTRESRTKAWNSRYAGKRAFGAISKNGYSVGTINNIDVYAHRVAWTMVFGFIPKGCDIDHVNRIRTDNRISNLRLAKRSSNNANRVSKEGSTSQYLGVSWSARYSRWVAQITKNYKGVLLGRFDSEIEAARVYDEAAYAIHGEFCRLNFSREGIA